MVVVRYAKNRFDFLIMNFLLENVVFYLYVIRVQ